MGIVRRFQPFAQPTIVDDRGQRVPLLDPNGTPWPVETDERVRLLAQRISAKMQDDATGSGRKYLIVTLVLVYMAVSVPLQMYLVGSLKMPAVVVIVLMMPVLLGCVYLVQRRYFQTSSTAIARLVLEEGLCPSCGYNLCGISPIAGAISVHICPECGSAWNADRVKRLEPFVGDVPANAGSARKSLAAAAKEHQWLDNWFIKRIHDSRDTPVPAVHPRLWRQLESAASEEHKARLLAARTAMRHAARGKSWKTYLLPGFLVLNACYLVFTSTGGARWWWMLVTLPFWVYMLVVAVASRTAGIKPDDVKRSMWREGLCASCGELLAHLAPGDDNCVECPRCRAAWRLISASYQTPTARCGKCLTYLDNHTPDEHNVVLCPGCDSRVRLDAPKSRLARLGW